MKLSLFFTLNSCRSALGTDNLLYQFSKNTGILKVYTIYPYAKDVILDETDLTPVVPNKIVGHSWMQDNSILVCDEFKNIYLLNSDGTQCQQLQKNNLGKPFSDKFLVQSFKSGFVITDENSFLTVIITYIYSSAKLILLHGYSK